MRRQKAAGTPCPSPSLAPCRGGHNPDPLAVPFSAHALRMAAASQSECRHQSHSQSRRQSQSLPTGLGHDVVPGDGGRKFTRVLNTRLPRTALRTRAPLACLPRPCPASTLPLCSVAKEAAATEIRCRHWAPSCRLLFLKRKGKFLKKHFSAQRISIVLRRDDVRQSSKLDHARGREGGNEIENENEILFTQRRKINSSPDLFTKQTTDTARTGSLKPGQKHSDATLL